QTLKKHVYTQEGGTIDLKNVKLIRIPNPQPGLWQVTTNSRLKHTIRIFGHGSIDFKFGFATRPLERIELAQPRPVSNQNTYLLVNMTGVLPPGMVNKIALLDYFGNSIYISNATLRRDTHQMYFVGPFFPPSNLFFVQINGLDHSGYKFQRIAPTAIGTVAVGGPRAYMNPTTNAMAATDVNITCTIESTSPFTLFWMKNNHRIGGPLFYRVTDTAVWHIPEVTNMDRGEYQCFVVSDNVSALIAESPPVFTGRTNFSTALGAPAFLHCQAQSSSDVEIRWSRFGVILVNDANTSALKPVFQMIHHNGTLQIFRTSQADAGPYECQAQNTGGVAIQSITL
ncbi:immunoglobulin domain protein, partial [Ostertagia ostertagi]